MPAKKSSSKPKRAAKPKAGGGCPEANCCASSFWCNCKDSAIRWVDEKHPHPATTREGWFCTECLTEYAQSHHLTDIQIERNTWLTKESDLKEHVRSLNIVIDIAQREITGLRDLLAASESLAEEYRRCALSSLHNAERRHTEGEKNL